MVGLTNQARRRVLSPRMKSHQTTPLFSRRLSAVLFASTQTAKVAAALLLAVAWEGKARGATIAFDELPTQTVHGVGLQGVTFGFQIGGVPSSDALFNSNALGANTTLNLQSPTLEGNANGVLTLDFAQPVSDLSFNLARLTGLTLTGATVALFDPSLNGFATTPVPVARLLTYSEGFFSYSGGPSVERVVVTFPAGAGPRFAIDNLAFTTAVPEPGTMLLGLLMTGAWAGARRSRRR